MGIFLAIALLVVGFWCGWVFALWNMKERGFRYEGGKFYYMGKPL